MKRLLTIVLSLTIAISFSFQSPQVKAANPKVVTFANCKEMNKVYPGGVARSATVKNVGGKTKQKPFVSQAIYDANKKSDRDKDLIACER
ncbi:excalibur calcium-binding domain-containing protein [Sporosarcina sp. YIM B06819]|uniref:excalibur calcium-binding domain-containing protein n=1 Tax=Sporosarcina sp. YIM B06819 TaxID=3081769 RepID=UPI00298C358B|nr:excalibur calcium-binding domain-containing protein [Sporosarcina sp. YIM B06819]